MDHNDKLRELKLIDSIFQFFGQLAECNDGNVFALTVCRHLKALKDQAIDDIWIASYIDIWHSQHPEEDSLTNDELLWALISIEGHFCSLVRAKEVKQIVTGHPDARFSIVNGGLSENPAIPYVNLNPDLEVHEYPDY